SPESATTFGRQVRCLPDRASREIHRGSCGGRGPEDVRQERSPPMADDATNIPVKKPESPAKLHDWAPFESPRREIDRLFEDWRLPSRFLGFEVPRVANANWQFAPAIDVVEKDDAYEITAELPGLDEKDVEIKLANNTLTIKGEKSEQHEDKQ